MSFTRQYWQIAMVGLTISACASSNSENFGFGGKPDGTASVSVESKYFGEVIIYVLNGSARTRIGTVGALSTATLPVPNELIGVNVQLLANPVSPGASYTSEYLLIPPGGTVSLRLADELGMSRISVTSSRRTYRLSPSCGSMSSRFFSDIFPPCLSSKRRITRQTACQKTALISSRSQTPDTHAQTLASRGSDRELYRASSLEIQMPGNNAPRSS